jgi:thioredoxin-related protein
MMSLPLMRGSGSRCLGAILLILIGVGAAPAFSQNDIVPWRPYEEALQDAQKSGRPVFLYFFVDNCVYCQKMDGQTLVSKRVVDYLKEGFVSVRVHAERSPQLARKYMVRGFPTAWFLTPDGKPISSLPGYLGPEEFTRVLRFIGGGHYRSKSLREYLEGS